MVSADYKIYLKQVKMKSTTQVRAAHILLKHTGSRNPNDSYRNVTQFIYKKITRDAEEAEKMLTEI